MPDRELPLLEREDELTVLRGAIEAARRGGGGLVVVAGPAGIGKTQLLRRVFEEARDRGDAETLRAVGSEHERHLPFGVVRQLLERRVLRAGEEEREALLAGAARLARPLFDPDLMATPPPAAALEHGLHWLVANLAEARPLVLVLDDAQWADEPSLRFLAYLAARIEDLPAALLVGERHGEPDAEPPLLTRLRAVPAARTLRPAALSAPAVLHLVRHRLPEAGEGFARACGELTHGNPFLLGELLEEATERGLTGRDDDVAALRRLAPEGVQRAIVGRLARLGASAAALARAIAVLGPDARPATAATLARVSPDDAQRALDDLVSAEVLLPPEPAVFAHPLIREAVYADVPFTERARAHGEAADLLLAQGASPERVATHLLSASPVADEARVDVLREAARSASARGAPDAAARYLERALSEAPGAAARRTVLLELGEAEIRAMRPEGVGHLRAALALTDEPAARGAVALHLGRALRALGEVHESALVLSAGARELDGHDPALAELLRAEFLGQALLDPELAADAFAEVEHRVAGLDEAVDLPPARRPLLAQYALTVVLGPSRPAATAIRAAERLLSIPGYLTSETPESQTYWMAVAVLSWADALDAAERHCDAALAFAVEHGSVLGHAWASYGRSWPRFWRGDLTGAVADAETAVERWSTGTAFYLPAAAAWLAHAQLERDDPAAAADAIERVGDAERFAGTPMHTLLLWARARLLRTRGDAAGALADLERAGAQTVALGITNPALCPWRSAAARAALDVRDLDRARTLSEEEVALARRFGAARPLGIALRARGVVRGRDGLGDLEEAVATLERSPAALELAHGRVELGAELRRQGRRVIAREQLRAGLEAAVAMGARGLERLARKELAAAGDDAVTVPAGDGAGLDTLTPAERRVVDLAAHGLSNRETAHALSVSRKAVEYHLRNAYGKLRVTSREELRRLVAP